MIHRILEAFFMAQVLVEEVLESAVRLKDEVAQAVKAKPSQPKRHSGRSDGNGYKSPEHPHTLQDLPAKFFSLLRQFSRYVFVSMLGEILGKS
jgi:hypothetical protein